MQAYDVLGLYFGLGRTFFNPASVWTYSPQTLLPSHCIHYFHLETWENLDYCRPRSSQDLARFEKQQKITP